MRELPKRRGVVHESSGEDVRYLAGLKHDLSTSIEKLLHHGFNAVQIEIAVPLNQKINKELVLPSNSVVDIRFVSGDPAVPMRTMRVRRTIGRNNGWTIEVGDGEISPQEQAVVLDALNRLRV